MSREPAVSGLFLHLSQACGGPGDAHRVSGQSLLLLSDSRQVRIDEIRVVGSEHDLHDDSFASRWFDSRGRSSRTLGLPCRHTSGIQQDPECAIHGIRVRKCLCQIWFEKDKVRSCLRSLIILAPHATFELRQIVLRPKIIFHNFCGGLPHIVSLLSMLPYAH